MDLESAIRDLGARMTPRDGYAAVEIASGAAVARGGRGHALFLPVVGAPQPPDISLKHISVRYDVSCDVQFGSKRRRGSYTVVECESQDPKLQGAFLSVLPAVFPASPEGGIDVGQVVQTLVELFAARCQPPVTSTLGLWGELFVLSTARDVVALAAAWHDNPRELFDFAGSGVRVEVKTAVGDRRHGFSLRQLTPIAGVRTVVATLITAPSAAGPSIQELVTTVSAKLDPEGRSRVTAIAMRSLGEAWEDGRNYRADRELARETLRYVPAEHVPQVQTPPIEVEDVHFTSDLAAAQAMARSELVALGGIASILA